MSVAAFSVRNSVLVNILMIAVVVIAMNLLADLLYTILDPRISHA